MKPRRTVSNYILLVGITGLLIAGSWLAYDLYTALIKSQITLEQKENIRPLVDTLDQDVLRDLSSRRQFNQTEIKSVKSIDYTEKKKMLTESETLPKILEETILGEQKK